MRRLSILLATATLTACGGHASPAGPWATFNGADQPLVGRVWSADRDAFLDTDDLIDALAGTDVVVLGEKHDNPDHHRLEAWILERLPTLGAVAFEMLDEDDAEPLAKGPNTAAELATAVGWEDSGWPHFVIYEPVFAVALARAAQLVAAHPSRGRLRDIMKKGLRLDPLLKLDPLSPDEGAQLEQEIRETHCGYAPEKMIGPMADAQRFKDAWMAARAVEVPAPRVLLAGAGHARRDIGVPLYLRRQGAGRVLSVAFVEVRAGVDAPGAYQPERFDFVFFTPRLEDADPCERFRSQLEQMGAMHAPAGPSATPGAADAVPTARRCTVYRAGNAEVSREAAGETAVGDASTTAIVIVTEDVAAEVPDDGVEAACAARAAERCGAQTGPDACRFEVHAAEPGGWDAARPLGATE